jgi:hypothetical protein
LLVRLDRFTIEWQRWFEQANPRQNGSAGQKNVFATLPYGGPRCLDQKMAILRYSPVQSSWPEPVA